MMTERELLELAAKAEGRTLKYMTQHIKGREPEEFIACWNPLTDDGDAFRLAVKLGVGVEPEYKDEFGVLLSYASIPNGGVFIEDHGEDRYAATRRAIVRAAAEIGRAM